jgi:hypothetical protein
MSPWFPIRSDQPEPGIRFVASSEVWLDGTGEDDRVPSFVPLLHRRLARLLDAQLAAQANLQARTDLRRWNNPDTLVHQIEYLARLFVEKRIHVSDESALLRSYRESWRGLATSGSHLSWTAAEEHLLLLESPAGVEVRSVRQERNLPPASPERSLRDGIWVRDEAHCIALDLMNALRVPVFDIDRDVAAQVAELLRPILGSSLRLLSEVSTDIIVDGNPLHEFASASESLRELCGAIDAVVLVAAASMSGVAARSLPVDHRQLATRLDKLRVLTARRISFLMEGVAVDLPANRYGVLLVWKDEVPHVLIECEGGSITWWDLARASGAIAEVLRQLPMEHALRAAIRVFERLGVPLGATVLEPELMEALALELGVGPQSIKRAVDSLGLVISRVIQMLRPVVCYWAGAAVVHRLDQDATSLRSSDALVGWIRANLPLDFTFAEQVVEACRRAGTLADLREELKLDFKRFNNSLTALDEAPERYPEIHRRVFESYCADQSSVILQRLGAPFFPIFSSYGLLDGYLRLLGKWKVLAPPESWLEEFAEPPLEVAHAWVDDWLITHGCPEVRDGDALEPLDALHRTNNRNVERFVAKAAAVVCAWGVSHSVVPHAWWRDGALSGTRFVDLLHSVGALDFEVLADDNIIRWFLATGVWPADMPLSIDASALGLPAEQLDSEDRRRQEERERNERQKRVLDFGGTELDPDAFDVAEVASRLRARTSELASVQPFGTESEIAAPHLKPSGGGGGGGGGGPGRRERLHPQKAGLIGMIGEIAVYQWLKEQFPRRNIDEAWVSENRSSLLPGEGKDSLGYDFELKFREKTRQIEVKTHVGDPLEIQLGESEVRAAGECARVKGKEYVILYVSHADDPGGLRIEQLPNPLSADAARRYALAGEGLRYSFERE